MINEAINRLIPGEDLEAIEIKEVFDEILSGLAGEIASSSFLTAFKIKRENADEVACAILASREFIKKIENNFNKSEMIENISFSKDKNYLYIKLASDIILSANNIVPCRYCFKSPFWEDEIFNLLNSHKIDFTKNIDNFNSEFEKTNFLYAYLNIDNPYFKYSENLRRELPFKTILNLCDKMLNPMRAKNCFVGVENKDDVEFFANVCLKLNYENSIIVSSENNLPFISLDSGTFIAEAWKNKIFTYVLTPELLGFSLSSMESFKCENLEHSMETMLEVFENKVKGAKYDIIIINSALALYISKKVPSIMDGIELARKTIDSSLAFDKFEQIRNAYTETILK